MGGPIFIPGHFNSDRRKLFFFFSHETWWTKLPQGITNVTVPTALERAGDFSQTVDQGGNLRVSHGSVEQQRSIPGQQDSAEPVQ